MAPIWHFKPNDGKPLIIRTAPAFDAAHAGAIKPGEYFYVCEEKEGEDSVTFLKLFDGRGWVFDSKPEVGILCERVEASLWKYDGLGDRQPLMIRATPGVNAARTGQALQVGSWFYVSEELEGDDGVLYLLLADGRGWVFDHKPGIGVMCTNQEAAFKSHLWRHTASDRLPLCIRESPDIHGSRTGLTLLAGETFQVSQELAGSDGVLYLQLDDGRGWVFESRDGSKILCHQHEAPVFLHIYDVPTDNTGQQLNGLFRAFGTGAFHAGVEVFGKEWSFGHTERQTNGTGVYWCSPKGCEAHRYREEVLLGYTALTADQVFKVVEKLQKLWAAKDYDMLRHNCCHFSDALCQDLGVEGLPFWVMHMANVGAVLDDRRLLVAEATSELLQQSRVTLEAVSATLSRGLQAKTRSLQQATCAGENQVIRFKDIGFVKHFDCLS